MSDGNPPLIADAFPDLVTGLVGVPVAFAIQEIAGKTLPKFYFGEYVRGVVFTIGIYGLYSCSMLLIFDESVRGVRKTDYLGKLIPFHIALAMTMTGLMIAVGEYYLYISLREWLTLFILAGLVSGPLISVILSHNKIIDYWQERRSSMSNWLLAFFVTFLIVLRLCGFW